MRPQLLNIIVLFIWLSLISIHSEQKVPPPLVVEQPAPSESMNSNFSAPRTQPPPSSVSSAKTPGGPTPRHTSPGPVPSSASNPQSISPAPSHKGGKGDKKPPANPPVRNPPRSNKGGPAREAEKKQPLGKKLGIWFLGIAGGLQVAAVAFLSFKRRQIPRILEKSGTQLGD